LLGQTIEQGAQRQWVEAAFGVTYKLLLTELHRAGKPEKVTFA
jgi:hypothetical protein